MTVAEADALLDLPGHPPGTCGALSIPALPGAWKASFRAMPGQPETPDGAAGALGLPRHAYGYACGPAVFMAEISAATTCIGLDSGEVHTGFFSAAPAQTPGIGSALICCSWPAGKA
jgi:hypothetical protein